MIVRKCRPIPLLLVLVWLFIWGCAQTNVRLGEETEAGAPTTGFTPPPDSDAGDAAAAAPVEALLCVGTECPAPFATCTAEDGPAYKCGTDLAHDPNNCGACGNECLVYKPLHMTSRCVDGACELECMNESGHPQRSRRNCNGLLDDGCEVDVFTDPRELRRVRERLRRRDPCIEGQVRVPAGLDRVQRPLRQSARSTTRTAARAGTSARSRTTICEPMPASTPTTAASAARAASSSAVATPPTATAMSAPASARPTAARSSTSRRIRRTAAAAGSCASAGEECVNEGYGPECAVPCAAVRQGDSVRRTGCVGPPERRTTAAPAGTSARTPAPNQVRSCNKGALRARVRPGLRRLQRQSAPTAARPNLMAHPAQLRSVRQPVRLRRRAAVHRGQVPDDGVRWMR